jgi:hypothetical protein
MQKMKEKYERRQVAFLLTPKEYDLLFDMAQANGVTMAHIARSIYRMGMRKQLQNKLLRGNLLGGSAVFE